MGWCSHKPFARVCAVSPTSTQSHSSFFQSIPAPPLFQITGTISTVKANCLCPFKRWCPLFLGFPISQLHHVPGMFIFTFTSPHPYIIDVNQSVRDGTAGCRSLQCDLAQSLLLLLNQVSIYFTQGHQYRSHYPPTLPSARGSQGQGAEHTCSVPWCNNRHQFINYLNHLILRAQGHLKLPQLCPRWAYVIAPKSMPLLEFLSASVPDRSYCKNPL